LRNSTGSILVLPAFPRFEKSVSSKIRVPPNSPHHNTTAGCHSVNIKSLPQLLLLICDKIETKPREDYEKEYFEKKD